MCSAQPTISCFFFRNSENDSCRLLISSFKSSIVVSKGSDLSSNIVSVVVEKAERASAQSWSNSVAMSTFIYEAFQTWR